MSNEVKRVRGVPLITPEHIELAYKNLMGAAAGELRTIANRLYEIEREEGLSAEARGLLDCVELNINKLTSMENR